jgi:hypothetical protein
MIKTTQSKIKIQLKKNKIGGISFSKREKLYDFQRLKDGSWTFKNHYATEG